jgi:hypothetical protein
VLPAGLLSVTDSAVPWRAIAAELRPYVAKRVVDADMTIRDAAETAGVSMSGMKSRVQRGRAQLREMLDGCCAIALDVRGKVTDVVPRQRELCYTPAKPPSHS